eukprot:9764728-Lingulodinium_polyedra.AAC.1
MLGNFLRTADVANNLDQFKSHLLSSKTAEKSIDQLRLRHDAKSVLAQKVHEIICDETQGKEALVLIKEVIGLLLEEDCAKAVVFNLEAEKRALDSVLSVAESAMQLKLNLLCQDL